MDSPARTRCADRAQAAPLRSRIQPMSSGYPYSRTYHAALGTLLTPYPQLSRPRGARGSNRTTRLDRRKVLRPRSALAAARAVGVRVDPGELGAQEEDLRRVVHPHH